MSEINNRITRAQVLRRFCDDATLPLTVTKILSSAGGLHPEECDDLCDAYNKIIHAVVDLSNLCDKLLTVENIP